MVSFLGVTRRDGPRERSLCSSCAGLAAGSSGDQASARSLWQTVLAGKTVQKCGKGLAPNGARPSLKECPAATYSPTTSRLQYHRRCGP